MNIRIRIDDTIVTEMERKFAEKIGPKFTLPELKDALEKFASGDLKIYDEKLWKGFLHGEPPVALGVDNISKALNNRKGQKNGVICKGNNDRAFLDLLCFFTFKKSWKTVLKDFKIDEPSLIQNDQPISGNNWNAASQYIEKVNGLSFHGELEYIYKREKAALLYTDYHVDRAKCKIFKNEENLFAANHRLNNIAAFNKLIDDNHFPNGKFNVAGDWYLLYEQREFLRETLAEIFKTYDSGTTIKLCEVSTPSFIHHFTFVSILIEALKEAGNNLNIELHVIEKYLFPLIQIGLVHNLIETTKGKLFPQEFKDNLGGCMIPDFKMTQEFIDFIQSDFDVDYYLSHIGKPIIANHDLYDPAPNGIDIAFDILTEHFMMNHLTRNTIGEEVATSNLRKNYKSIANKKMHLLCAVGDVSTYDFDFFKFHKKIGFEQIDHRHVWDIYDENFSTLHRYEVGSQLEPKSNLFHWIYMKK